MRSSAVIFDLGGVVLSWDPRGAYERVLPVEQIATFLERVDFASWNRLNDGGRPFEEAEQELIGRFPDDRKAILGYRTHFDATLTGMVPGTSGILAELGQAGVRLIALTNWSAETFPVATERFGILRRFEAIVVSGAERLLKPEPALYQLTLDRHGLSADSTVFVDDSPVNVAAAATLGIAALNFTDAERLRADLVELGLLGEPQPIPEPVFHLAERSAWAVAETTGRYPWSSRGLGYEREGFVHCSFAEQVPSIVRNHYADVDPSELVVLEIDRERVPILVEDLGHGPYPHCFAELTPADVLRVHGLPIGAVNRPPI
jgi:2-haloacid dehalogenase